MCYYVIHHTIMMSVLKTVQRCFWNEAVVLAGCAVGDEAHTLQVWLDVRNKITTDAGNNLYSCLISY